MRFLFLLLLLANLLFLGWTYWVVPVPPAETRHEAAEVPLQPIRLRQEAATESSATEATGAAPEAVDPQAASCVSVGPFADPAHVRAAAAALDRLGFTHRTRTGTDEVRVGSWVRVPNLATAEDANNALASLQAAGLTDAYALTDEEAGSLVVSLGVYADARKVEQVAATARQAGFTPQVTDRTRTLEVAWLDVDRQANGGLPSLDALAPQAEGALPLELRACPAATPVTSADPATGAPAAAPAR